MVSLLNGMQNSARPSAVKWSTPITTVAPVYKLAVPSGIQGSFVRVLNKPGQQLHMAEVEV